MALILITTVDNKVTQNKNRWQLLSTCYIFLTLEGRCCYSSFTDKETEAQGLGFEAQHYNLQSPLPQASLSCSLGLISTYLSNFSNNISEVIFWCHFADKVKCGI